MISFTLVVTVSTNAGTQALYIANKSNSTACTPWFGMVLQNTNATPLPSVTFNEAWKADGINNIDKVEGFAHYIFFPVDPVIEPAELLQNLVAYITGAQGKFFPRYFLWINNPDLYNAGGTSLNSSIVFGPNTQGVIQVTQDSAINFANIFFSIPLGVGVSPATGNDGFTFTLTSGYSSMGIVVDKDFGKYPYLNPVDPPVNFFVEGDAAFVFTFPMQLLVQPALQNDFISLQVGLKYFTGTAANIIDQLYPVFGLPQPATETLIPFNVSLDCFYPLVVNRTFFQFNTTFADSTPVLFNSSFVTDYGHTVLLSPDGVTASLVMQGDNIENPNVPTYHMAPQGKFYLSLATDDITVAPKIMCGLSGTETISFSPATKNYSGDIMVFEAGNKAYAATISPTGNNQSSSKNPADLLTGLFTTSWIGIVPSVSTNTTTYYAQPSASPLYAPATGVNIYAKDFLGFFEPPSKSFTSTNMQLMPMVPYINTIEENSGSVFSVDDFEKAILAPCRKALLTQNKTLSPAALASRSKATDTSFLSTTPQGLLAQVDPASGKYFEVTLAKNSVKDQNGNITTYTLNLLNVDDTLRDALQTNQLCLVATTNTHIGIPPVDNPPAGSPIFQNEMSIEGWPFLLDVGKNCSYGDYANVMIFKFCPGTLKEVVANTNVWTQSADFNKANEVQAVSQWLQDYFSYAEQQWTQHQDPYFQNFYTIINTLDWNGILVLKTDISLTDFPQQLQGLLAGIDLSKFYGHHFGINVNHVTAPSGAPLQMAAQSSLFGLIDYEDVAYQLNLQQGGQPDDPVPPQPGDYDFKVLLLKILLENSATKAFSSKVQVSIQQLFSDAVKLNPSEQANNYNCIVLNGSYQNHDGTATYVFDQTGDNVFVTATNVLQSINITKIQFNTLRNQASDAATKVHSRFSLWGYLKFYALPKGMDVFSFGTDDTRTGLYFSNLYIDMNFDATTPSVKQFSFDITQIAFDSQQSIARSTSLYNGFPITPTGMIRGSGKDTPTTAGYLKVGVPYQGSLADEWFAIVYRINMGTAGALASSAGFDSNLLTAWSPGSTGNDQFKTMTGLQLPGTSGAGKLMSIEGVLKLAIETLKLEYVPVQSGAAQSAYLLTMSNIALKFLGIVKIPPSATISCYLFGDPAGNTGKTSLGWYAAYVQGS